MACGPSAGEQAAVAANANLAQTMQGNYQTRFAGQTDVLNSLNAQAIQLQNEGLPPEELADLNTAAINQSAAANRNASQAAQTTLAGRGGGGDSGLASGIDRQIAGSIASSSANQLAGNQLQIGELDAQTRRANLLAGTQIQQNVAEQENPTGFGTLASQTGAQNFAEQDKLSAEQNAASPLNLVASLAGPAMSFATGGISNVLAGGANAGSGNSGGIGNFFSGGFDKLAGG